MIVTVLSVSKFAYIASFTVNFLFIFSYYNNFLFLFEQLIYHFFKVALGVMNSLSFHLEQFTSLP